MAAAAAACLSGHAHYRAVGAALLQQFMDAPHLLRLHLPLSLSEASAINPFSPQRNYRYFLAFITSTTLLCCWVFAMCVLNIWRAATDRGGDVGAAIG